MQHVLDILEIINKEPNLSQKKIAERSGISTGKVNYIINDLTKKNYVVSEKNGKHISYYVKEQGLKFLQSELATMQQKKIRIHQREYKKVKQAVILAAGNRKELGKPSGLLSIGDKILLNRNLEILHNNGIEKVVIVSGYKKEKFASWNKEQGVYFVENPKYKWTGSMASLSSVQSLITDDFLLIEDDILIEEDAISQLLQYPERDCVLITNESGSGDEAFVEIQNGNLYKISKDVHQLNRIDGEMIGISKLSYDVFLNMLELFNHNQNPYVNYEYLLLDVARTYDIGHIKLQNIVWAEIDTKQQYEAVRNKIYPRLLRKEAEFKEKQIKGHVMEALNISEDAITNIQPFGGMTNTNFKVSVGDSEYVLRIPGSGTEEMISRHDEMVNSNLASELGIDAELLYFNEETGVKLAELISNAETLNPKTARRSDNMQLTAAILKELHESSAAMSNTFNVFEKIEHYEGLLSKSNGSNFADYKKVKKQVMRLKAMYEKMDVQLTPCHNDTVAENFVKNGENKMYLIDWEYGGLNDPMWDIAAHSLECEFSAEDEELFLDYYFNGKVEEMHRQRILLNKIFQDFLWSIWTKIKEAAGSDFGTYGMDRYTRAKENLQLFLEYYGGYQYESKAK
ncbi:LPS biosynthesis choline kinase [Bacillus toyonensis]|uniref:phosphocholine cytidylyltransferase/choline kinase family protein n=1 Tax=Bacillus toyonensis TaxID=155322 RepID=UPI000BFE43D3|nr:phosphocholine cytidylyltransferase/choline kinase family protein [Bacillus toyonensis]PHF50628.1 LPS biosynthesis choline kinase [Bacillus toyonensis]